MTVTMAWKRATLSKKLQIKGYLFLLPFMIYFLAFILVPFLYSVTLSLTDFNLLKGQIKFVGLENYISLLGSSFLYKVLLNTFYFIIPVVVGWIVIGLMVGLLLNQRVPGRDFFRFVVYIPVVIDWIVVSLIWTYIFDPTFGLANFVLRGMGLPAHHFLQSSTEAMPTLIATALWKGFGYYAVFYLAGLQDIPLQLYDAAQIDGAGPIRTFFSVVLPQLAPVTTFVVLMALINAFQFFDPFYLMTGGGPVQSTTVLIFQYYQVSFGYMELGSGSTLAMIFTLIVFLLLLLARRSLMRTAGAID